MNREEAKKFVDNADMLRRQLNNLDILQEYAEGKTIQFKLYDGTWEDMDDTWFFDANPDKYRVKPEVKYIKCGDKIYIEDFGVFMLCQVAPNKGMLISITEGNRYSDTTVELNQGKATVEDVDAVVKEYKGSSYRVVEE